MIQADNYPTEDISYKVITGEGEDRFTEKGSKFIGFCAPAETEEAAQQILNRRSKTFYDATHNCWAMRVGDPFNPLDRYSDAGEPNGTAGKPIFDRIIKAEVVRVIVIVTRYYGGTKLGRGGLVRAYGHGAEIALDAVKKKIIRPHSEVIVNCAYDLIGLVEKLAAQYEGKVVDGDYAADVNLRISMPSFRVPAFADVLFDQSAGRVNVNPG